MADRSLASFLHRESLAGGVDFHLHSSFSDGVQTPGQLVREAIEKKLRAFSLTDHDSMAGIPAVREAMEGQPDPALPHFVPGVECSARFEGQEIHVLGYFTQDCPPAMAAFLAVAVEERARRNQAMIERLQALGYGIRPEDLVREEEGYEVSGRVHLALWLVRNAGFLSISQAFRELLGEGKPAYVPRQRRSAEEIVSVIEASGGVAVLAHPQQYGWCSGQDAGAILKSLRRRFLILRDAGLAGIECFHGQATPEESEWMRRTADELGMICTAGSDSHGRDDHHAPMYEGGSGGLSSL